MQLLTRNGVLMDLVSPDESQVDWDAIAWSASGLVRWVAHSETEVRLSSHCRMIAAAAVSYYHQHLYTDSADLDDIIYAVGLLHDAGETCSGDINNPFRAAFVTRVGARLKGLGVPSELLSDVRDILLDELEATHIKEVIFRAAGVSRALELLSPSNRHIVWSCVGETDKHSAYYEATGTYRPGVIKSSNGYHDRYRPHMEPDFEWSSWVSSLKSPISREDEYLWYSRNIKQAIALVQLQIQRLEEGANGK